MNSDKCNHLDVEKHMAVRNGECPICMADDLGILTSQLVNTKQALEDAIRNGEIRIYQATSDYKRTIDRIQKSHDLANLNIDTERLIGRLAIECAEGLIESINPSSERDMHLSAQLRRLRSILRSVLNGSIRTGRTVQTGSVAASEEVRVPDSEEVGVGETGNGRVL